MKWMTLTAALMVCAGINSAEAGLFGCHKKSCCEPVCCEVQTCEPVCCEPAPSCCDSGCGHKHGGFLKKLFGGCHKKNNCCQPSCCEAAPVCCEPAPTCCAPAPVCCEPAPVCCEPAPTCCNNGCKKPCFLSKLFGGCKKNNCCQPAADCGCGAPAACSTCGH